MAAPFARVTTTFTYILLDLSYSNSLRLERYSIPHSVADVSSRFASIFVTPPAPLPYLFLTSPHLIDKTSNFSQNKKVVL